MDKFIVGDIVAIPFPFSDLSGNKLRPALILAKVEHGDLILCQITSKSYSSKLAIEISSSDFLEGELSVKSYIRPDKLFTANTTIIRKYKGKLKKRLFQKVLSVTQKLFILH